jgi:hypothetical protein
MSSLPGEQAAAQSATVTITATRLSTCTRLGVKAGDLMAQQRTGRSLPGSADGSTYDDAA